MKISVVTVCYNSAATIRHTLESFCRQDHCDKELVIVDGASTDGTLRLVEEFRSGQNVILISEPDHGIYDAMNKGLQAFTGDAVGFLNSDDRFSTSGSLAAIDASLVSADMVYGHLDFVSGHQSGRVLRRWRTTPHVRGGFRSGWVPAHPTFYVRRRVVDAVGRFDLSYRIASDYDYMLRAFELHPFRSELIDRVLVDMQHGGRSTTGLKSYVIGNLESHRARRARLGVGLFDSATLAKPLRKVHQLF